VIIHFGDPGTKICGGESSEKALEYRDFSDRDIEILEGKRSGISRVKTLN
jgi:hypothetical protein